MPADSTNRPPQDESAKTRKECHTLLSAVPEPILIADVSTGEIVDANEAATSLLDRSRAELVGSHQSDLHPNDAESQYRQLFARHADAEGTKRTLPDGSQIQLLTGNGERIPVEINAKRHELDGREVMVGVFNDRSGQVAKEDTTSRESWYETFFENNPMNIWAEDLSALKAHLDSLAAEVDSLETYLHDHPEAVKQAVGKIEVIDVNQNAVEYYDATSKAELKTNLSSLFTEEAYRKFIDVLLAIANGKTNVEIETSSCSLAGETRAERIELYVPEGFEDAYRRAYLITHDITDRRARERELRSFKQAVENAGHSVIITDEEGTIEYVNPTFEAVTGYTKDEVIGRNPRLLKSGEHGESFYERLWETILGGEVWSSEVINETKNGERFVIDQTIAPIVEEKGAIQGFVAVNQDITDRRARERELRNLKQAVEYAGHSIYITDTDGSIEYVNEAFESLTGYSATEATGETHALFRPDGKDTTQTDRRKTLLEGKEWTGEMLIDAKTGERVVVDETVAPIEDAVGLRRGFVGIQTDITHRKLREQQLAVFARVLRHNLRNDGTTIKGRAQLLAESITDPDEIEHLDAIRENIDSLLEIGEKAHHVQQTIAESLAVDGTRDLIDVLEHMATAVNGSFPQAEVTVTNRFDEMPQVDPRIVPAIQELLHNAVEHNDAAVPTVEVQAGPANGMAEIAIHDNGPGVPAAERRVIEEGTEEPLKHGSGLGLWLAYWLTTIAGGNVHIESGAEGTTVSVTVPFKPD